MTCLNRYPSKTMELVNKLAAEVAREFREGRKGKLKRTFVGAQDAAGAKAKGNFLKISFLFVLTMLKFGSNFKLSRISMGE